MGLKPWLMTAALAAIIAAGVIGCRIGYVIADRAHARALLKAQGEAFENAERLSRIEAERLRENAAYEQLSRALEDQARADSDDGQCALPAGRVRRLNLR